MSTQGHGGPTDLQGPGEQLQSCREVIVLIYVTDSLDKNGAGRLRQGCLRLLLCGGLPLHSQTQASFSYSVHTLRDKIKRDHCHGVEALFPCRRFYKAAGPYSQGGYPGKRRMSTSSGKEILGLIHGRRSSPTKPRTSLLLIKYFSLFYPYGI